MAEHVQGFTNPPGGINFYLNTSNRQRLLRITRSMTWIPERIDAVVFDMDGTLLNTEALYKEVLIRACRELGHVMTETFHRGMIGHPSDRNRAALMREFGPDFPMDRYVALCRAGIAERCRDGVPLKPGARAVLGVLRAHGVPTAIATSSMREDTLRNLADAGILDGFGTIVTRNDVTHGKPHPETFLLAAERLHADPLHCIAVEDSYNGVRAAHAAGMHAIMVPDILEATDEIRALCRFVAGDLDEFAAALHALQPRNAVLRAISA